MDVKIPLQDLQFGELLGKGAFGAVFKGRWKDQDVAIKKVWNMADYDTDRYFAREVEILSSIHHPYIVGFLGTSKDGTDLCLIAEFVKGHNLREHLALFNPSWEQRTKFAIQLAMSLEYLHKTRIIHRDVKTENALVDEATKTCKLCDFGFSRSSSNTEAKAMTFVGSEWFEAPEIMFCVNYDERIDIFSYGLVLCEILSRQAPSMSVFKRVVPGFGVDPEEISSRAEPGAPKPLIHIAIACCEDDPNKRPQLIHIIETLKTLHLELTSQTFAAPQTSLPVPRKSISIPGKQRKKLTNTKNLPNEILTTKLEGEIVLSKLNLEDARIAPENDLELSSPVMTTPVTPSPATMTVTTTPKKSKSPVLEPKKYSNPVHKLKLVRFTTPTYCNECKYFIWGLSRQGYHCKVCNINVHKKCNETTLPCPAPSTT